MKLSHIFGATFFATFSTFAQADDSAAEYFAREASRQNTPALHQSPIAPTRTSQKAHRHSAKRTTAKHTSPAKGGSGALASWYGGGEKLSRHTASGEVFRPNGLTAAHRSLPLGTRLYVSANGHSVMVRVNDRGPAAWTGRSLDLSKGAARALGMIGKGTARVSWRTA